MLDTLEEEALGLQLVEFKFLREFRMSSGSLPPGHDLDILVARLDVPIKSVPTESIEQVTFVTIGLWFD